MAYVLKHIHCFFYHGLKVKFKPAVKPTTDFCRVSTAYSTGSP